MERFNFRRAGLAAIIGLIGMAKQTENAALENMARGAYAGGYDNSAHGWAGKRRKVKGRLKPTGRRSKAQRRAGAA